MNINLDILRVNLSIMNVARKFSKAISFTFSRLDMLDVLHELINIFLWNFFHAKKQSYFSKLFFISIRFFYFLSKRLPKISILCKYEIDCFFTEKKEVWQ